MCGTNLPICRRDFWCGPCLPPTPPPCHPFIMILRGGRAGEWEAPVTDKKDTRAGEWEAPVTDKKRHQGVGVGGSGNRPKKASTAGDRVPRGASGEGELLMAVRQLPANVINRIAAGEVIERPASVVKELVENAIDAGARHINVVTQQGGRALIQVSDDGHGMDESDLALCVERHATSKLSDDDLLNIDTLGFRGEALPSIGSVARLTIVSRAHTGDGQPAEQANEIRVEGGRVTGPRPAAHNRGTRVEVRDLFYATPARLKFLKSERAETANISDVVKRLAMAHPEIGFSLTTGSRAGLRLAPVSSDDTDGLLKRLGRIMGPQFVEDALTVTAARDAVTLSGFAGVPTLHRANAMMLFSLRQWPAGARQTADRCGACGLWRFSAQRALSDDGLVFEPAAARGGCERASGKGGSAVPRSGPYSRYHRWRFA